MGTADRRVVGCGVSRRRSTAASSEPALRGGSRGAPTFYRPQATHWQRCAEAAWAGNWSLCRWIWPYALHLRIISRTGLATWISLGRSNHGHGVVVAAVACWSEPYLECFAPSVHAYSVTTPFVPRFRATVGLGL